MVWLQQPNGSIFCISLLPPGSSRVMEVVPPVSGKAFKSFSAAADAVWTVMDDGAVFVRKGITKLCPQGVEWTLVNLTQLGQCKIMIIILLFLINIINILRSG